MTNLSPITGPELEEMKRRLGNPDKWFSANPQDEWTLIKHDLPRCIAEIERLQAMLDGRPGGTVHSCNCFPDCSCQP